MWTQQHSAKGRYWTSTGLARVVALSVWYLSTASFSGAATQMEPTHPQLLPGDRVLLGTVDEIRSDQARINTGELQPPAGEAAVLLVDNEHKVTDVAFAPDKKP